MRFCQVHLKLQPASCLTVIECSLAAANKGVSAGLEVEIRLSAHRFHNINDSREANTERFAFFARKRRDFEVFGPDAKDYFFPNKLTRRRTLCSRKRYINCTTLDFGKSDLLAVLF